MDCGDLCRSSQNNCRAPQNTLPEELEGWHGIHILTILHIVQFDERKTKKQQTFEQEPEVVDFTFDNEYREGVWNYAADCLSRQFTKTDPEGETSTWRRGRCRYMPT